MPVAGDSSAAGNRADVLIGLSMAVAAAFASGRAAALMKS